MKPLNILYLHSHDTGRYIQPYGYAVPTPNIQNLAEEGVVFRQAFCANPTCSASRAALLTGSYPHNNGMLALVHRGGRLKDPRQHLASFLREQGYLSVLAGFQHEAPEDQRRKLGYERLLSDEVPVANIADPQEADAWRAAQFIRRQQNADCPFFLSCGFSATHRTVGGEQPHGDHLQQWHNGGASPMGDPRYVRPPTPLPDTAATRRDFADFCVSAGRLDHYMGIVLDALRDSGLAGNMLVICTTDHGIAFPLMKCNLTDHGIGVMLILHGPGGFTGGKVVDALVSHIDVYPTICELAGLALPQWLQGTSMLPLVTGQADEIRQEVFASVNYHAAYEPMRCIRTRRYKYIRRWNVQNHPILPNCDDSISKELLAEYGWPSHRQDAEQLFDLAFDPNEGGNLAGDARYGDVLKDLRQRLDNWMRQTNDPLLTGSIPPWPGLVANPLDGWSPSDKPR